MNPGACLQWSRSNLRGSCPVWLSAACLHYLGPLVKWLTFCQEQEQNSVNVASSTPAQPPGTLPSDLYDITDTSTFRKRLKNVLFDCAYNWLLLALLDESYSSTLQISRWLIDWLIDWSIGIVCRIYHITAVLSWLANSSTLWTHWLGLPAQTSACFTFTNY